jgi:hypothetical protein
MYIQRSLVADESFAARWQAAFDRGETACERLGGVHLLAFGIYSFKAVSPGERTDLILGTTLDITEIESASDAIVLTEWKKVPDPTSAKQKADEAFEQAKLYGQGSLPGFELSSRRYLVLVSEAQLPVSQDRTDMGIVYQYKNVAVRPSPPSTVAKK